MSSRTYTVTRREPFRGQLKDGHRWCDKCQQAHTPKQIEKLEPWHERFLGDEIPLPTLLTFGSVDLEFPANRVEMKGVPEALALAAAETGKFDATLENPEPVAEGGAN